VSTTAAGDGATQSQTTEPLADVSQAPPAESEPTEGRSAGIDALREWRESGGQIGPRRDPIEKAAANPTSLRLAINAKCYDCVGQDADPAWQRRVRECDCQACSLLAVRPYQTNSEVTA
jgi:hypothetical protein